MKKEITNQLQKAYIAIKNAGYMNEITIEPNSKLRNRLITIEEILEEILEYNKKEI